MAAARGSTPAAIGMGIAIPAGGMPAPGGSIIGAVAIAGVGAIIGAIGIAIGIEIGIALIGEPPMLHTLRP